MQPPPLGSERTGGCRRTVGGAVALVVLAPLAAVARSSARWRRGRDVRVSWRSAPFATDDRETVLIDVDLDVPVTAGARLRRELTDAVVRLAEGARQADDVYHLVYRVPTEPESVALPVGASVQALAERFALALGQHDLEGRTAVWMAMPQTIHLADVLDPFAYDPEAGGEPHGLLARTPARWAMATTWVRGAAATRLRVLLLVPAARRATVEGLLLRLQDRLTDV